MEKAGSEEHILRKGKREQMWFWQLATKYDCQKIPKSDSKMYSETQRVHSKTNGY